MRQENCSRAENKCDMSHACLKLWFFGAFAIEVDGAALNPPRWKKTQWLLALLALRQGRDVSRTWLAETLWPDSELSTALFNLRQTLAQDLRPSLGAARNCLRSSTPSTLCLEIGGVWSDLSAFDAAIKSGKALGEAVALYNGPFLEGCTEEWAIQERAAREEAFHAALESLAREAASRHQFAEAAGYLRRCIASSPLRETAHVALMQALSASGDQAGVTQAYRDLRLILRSELNSEPDARTRTLYERLRQEAHDHPLPPSVPRDEQTAASRSRRLPIPLTRLIGRNEEIEGVRDRFRRGRLVTLLGVGGVGKTRLSIAIAEAMASGFPDGVWFVDLAPVENALLVWAAVAAVFQVELQQGQTMEEALIGSLESRSLLMILDNCEHLLESSARLAQEILSRCPNVRILATSRQPLGITGEWVFRVPSLEIPRLDRSHPTLGPGKDRLDVLLDFDAVRLFVERAAAQKERFKPDAAEIVAIAEICDLLDGIPLAIEMAAARVRSISIISIRERLTDRFALLKSGSRAALPRHQTLRALIEWSYRLLNAQEKLLLARLSVFAGGCTLEAAEAVCAEKEGTGTREEGRELLGPHPFYLFPAHLLDLMTSLVDKSLVVYEEGNAYHGARYRLLATIREYALEQLADGEREEAERRHADFYLRDALLAEADVSANETYGPQRRRMLPDSENYRAAMQKWADRDSDIWLAMQLALDHCAICEIDRKEREAWFYRLESAQLPVASPLQAKLYLRIALHGKYLPNLTWVPLMEKAIVLATACGEKAVISGAEYSLAELDLNRGNTEMSKERLAIALECANAANIYAQAAGVRGLLISIACAEKDFAGAQLMAESLMHSGVEANHWSTAANGLHALAEVALHREDFGRAREYLKRTLAVYPETASMGRTNTLRRLARLASLQGDYSAARHHLDESLAICVESDDLPHEAWTYAEYGFCEHQQGNDTAAFNHAKHALSIFDFLGLRSEMADCLRHMARWAESSPAKACSFWCTYASVWRDVGFSNHERDEEIAAAFATLQSELSAAEFTEIYEEWNSMPWREAVRHVYSR